MALLNETFNAVATADESIQQAYFIATVQRIIELMKLSRKWNKFIDGATESGVDAEDITKMRLKAKALAQDIYNNAPVLADFPVEP